MLYCTHVEVRLPPDMDAATLNALRDREQERAHVLQQEGKLLHLWRVAGRMANISVWDCIDHDELHTLLSSLPMFPYFSTTVTPLARHPSALPR